MITRGADYICCAIECLVEYFEYDFEKVNHYFSIVDESFVSFNSCFLLRVVCVESQLFRELYD